MVLNNYSLFRETMKKFQMLYLLITKTIQFRFSICSILLITTYSNLIIAQSVFEDKQKEAIVKNKITSQTTWDYNYIKNKLSKSGVKTSFIRYNQEGNTIESVTYKMKDTLAYETYKYNTEGKRTDYTKKKGLKIAYRKTSEYNEKGNLVKEEGFDGTFNFENKYSYFPDGKLKKIEYYVSDKLNEERNFEHTGDLTMITVTNASGAVQSYISLKHDNNGNVTEEIVYDAQKNPLEKKLMVYNIDNQVVSEVKYRGDNFSYKQTYLYNNKGNLVNIDEENKEEGRFSKKQFGYDENGNLISMKWRRNAKEDFSERNYQYDEKNLCTQYETYYPGTKFRVLTKLTYED